MLVLVTRPHEQAAGTARLLESMGHTVLLDPVLEVCPLPFAPPQPDTVAGLAVTSINAVPALRACEPDLPVFAVGEATAAAARAAGRSDVQVAAGDGLALAELIAHRIRPEQGLILHLAGTDVRPGLEQALASTGHRYCRTIVYAAVPRDELAPGVEAALRAQRVDAVLLYSPRSAVLWTRKIERHGLGAHLAGMTAVCLSPAVAQPLAGLALGAVRIARMPDQKSLLGCLDAP